MSPFTYGLLGAILFTHPVLPSAGDEGNRCTIVPLPSARDPAATYFVGTAAADTVLAGLGSVEPTGAPGHSGSGQQERRIYGQVIDVDRFAGADSVELARAFEQQGSNKVVIVPWDYDAGCQTTYWHSSAQWVPLGEPGLYELGLRPRSDWANGFPTFDAFTAARHPYPLGIFFQHGYLGTEELRTGPSLTAAEYFEFYRGLPERSTIEQNPEHALQVVIEWQQANPESASKYPATSIVASVKRGVNMAFTRRHAQGMASPLVGTYRFTFSLTGSRERIFYARTYAAPGSAWFLQPGDALVDTVFPPPRPEGYVLPAAVAISSDAFPATDCAGSPETGREIQFAVVANESAERSHEWLGSVWLDPLAWYFPADSVLQSFRHDNFTRSIERYRQNLPAETPARITREQDGSVSIEQTIRLGDGREAVIHGSRVSEQTIACSRGRDGSWEDSNAFVDRNAASR
jgi:hypothetical protein